MNSYKATTIHQKASQVLELMKQCDIRLFELHRNRFMLQSAIARNEHNKLINRMAYRRLEAKYESLILEITAMFSVAQSSKQAA